MLKPELIAPAGDLEKLKIAFVYGADAVYASTPNFSMRTREIGFDYEALKEGIEYAHSIDKKVYLTLNVYPHPNEIADLKDHVKRVIDLKPDAVIAADPGVISLIRSQSDIPIHLSTQANATNQLAIDFWAKQGIERIVLARELSLEEINIISQSLRGYGNNARIGNEEQLRNSSSLSEGLRADGRKTLDDTGFVTDKRLSSPELEAFVHGSMCMAYSGRCQLSNYLTGRDPNRGECVQACRFNYRLNQDESEFALEEEKRPGEYFPIMEDKHGTYILNSKDLCMVEHIDKLVEAGVASFKIEGRGKGIYYLGCVIRTYRQAIDTYCKSPKQYQNITTNLKDDLEKVANRQYTTGFYFGKPDKETNNYDSSRPESDWGYVGLIINYSKKTKEAMVLVKNYLPQGAKAQIITPKQTIDFKIDKIIKDGAVLSTAHANSLVTVPCQKQVPDNSFLRIKK